MRSLAFHSVFAAALLAALAAAAGSATAQVAAPSLNPVLVLTTVPANPAVLSWDTPTRASVSLGTLDEDLAATPNDPDLKGNLRAVELAAVGDTFAAAVASLGISLDYQSPLSGSSTSNTTVVYLAGRFVENFTVGYGIEASTSEDTLLGTNTEEDTPLLGVTLRLGGAYYLGFAGGTATVRDVAVSPAVEGSRSVTRYGLAYHTRETDRGLHVELFHELRESTTTPGTDAQSSNGAVVEVVLANVLVGVVANRQESKTPAGVDNGSSAISAVSVGYVGAPGLAVVASRLSVEHTDPAGVTDVAANATTVGLAWQF